MLYRFSLDLNTCCEQTFAIVKFFAQCCQTYVILVDGCLVCHLILIFAVNDTMQLLSCLHVV